jgi:hypothetical protein
MLDGTHVLHTNRARIQESSCSWTTGRTWSALEAVIAWLHARKLVMGGKDTPGKTRSVTQSLGVRALADVHPYAALLVLTTVPRI